MEEGLGALRAHGPSGLCGAHNMEFDSKRKSKEVKQRWFLDSHQMVASCSMVRKIVDFLRPECGANRTYSRNKSEWKRAYLVLAAALSATMD